VIDPRRRFDRRSARRWPPARQWRRGHRGSGSGELRVELSHWVRVGSLVGAREELGVNGRLQVRAEQEAHRRR
jgi:hypothetical protein